MPTLRFDQTKNFNWYIILWISALVVALYLYSTWHLKQNYIGIVENKSHLIGAQEAGRVHKVLTTIGDKVKKDQVLAIFDISDLKTNLNQLRNELASIQQFENAHLNRYSIFIQRMGLQLENEASDLMDRLSLIESKSTELAGLNAEIKRLQNAEKAGLGHSRDLTTLVLQRDALESYLREQSKDLEYQSQKLEKTRLSRNLFEEADIDSMAKSVFLERMEHAEMLRRQISTTEYRIQLRTITSPGDGFVTEIYARPGDVVQEFAPVLTVEEIRPRFMTLYIPEKSTDQPEIGMKVDISSSRSRDFNTTGVVTFVHPGFSRAAERLSFRGQIFWARKVQVALIKDHNLVPGEIVNARIGDLAKTEDYLATATAAENATIDNGKNSPRLLNIEIADSLGDKSRFEPSGIVWIHEIGRYLIVSDDTGIQNSNSEHAPFLFLMDENGKVESDRVRLSGIKKVSDLEAITPAGNGVFYLVSSQNISKKGKRPARREKILKIKAKGRSFSVQGEVKLLSLLLKSYSREKLVELGLEKSDKDGLPVLNIEGAAFQDNTLYFGLKEPVTDKGAIIWKLDDVDSVFEKKRLQPDQLSVYGYVQLGNNKNRSASISDLTFDQSGILWALSSVADVDNKDQLGGFHRINRFADGRLEAVRLFSFPGLKPEGVCLQGPTRFMIVFDKDDELPAFCYVDVGVK